MKKLELLAATVTTTATIMRETSQGTLNGAELIEEHSPDINPNIMVVPPPPNGDNPKIVVIQLPPVGDGDNELNPNINPNIDILQPL